ncbi:manganese-binding transcriptional regulator MntR [soil metagenome]
MKVERDQTAVENYLKTLFGITEWDSTLSPTTAQVATGLGVTPSSVSSMVNKLAGLGYVEHERYGAIELTQAGRMKAMSVVRRHRLLETYLVRALGFGWDEVHDEAEVLEHAVSDLMVERMDAALGYPWRDPHGDPIPTADGVFHQPVAWRLSELEQGETGYIARISDDDPDMLRYFQEHAIGLDSAVTIVERRPFGASTRIEVQADKGPEPHDLGELALDSLWATRKPPLSRELSAEGCTYPDCRHAAFAAGRTN